MLRSWLARSLSRQAVCLERTRVLGQPRFTQHDLCSIRPPAPRTFAYPYSSSSSLSSSSSSESPSPSKPPPQGGKSEKEASQRSPRRFRKQYPPPQAQPEAVVFDKPAVPNPIETAEAHARFKRGTRIALGGAVWLVIIGGAVYAGWSVMHADEGGVSVDLPKEEMERKVQEAQKGHGKGSYAALAVKRSTTIAKAVALCVLDYRSTLNGKYSSKAEEDEALRQCHLRSANRVLVALQSNGGLYVKLGQHMSSIILLPVEWTTTLKPLQDQNTPTPLYELEAMFRNETGRTFNEAFSEIDPNPIGVASLAQVHRAVDRETGQPLAIKMMHPEVERFCEVDMATVNVLVRWVKRVFPQFEFTWLAEEMNINMPLEMDFRHEAENARRATENFADYRSTSLYIPTVPWVFKRVMAMEFIDGRRPDDLAYLAAHKIDRNRVSQELSRIFAQMLYLHGFFHADPHGGNVLIRPAPRSTRSPNNFEVVLLDHGLYFDIEKDLRVNYARFWLCLLSRATPRVQAARRHYAKLIANIDDDLYPILESAITGRAGLEGSDPKNPLGVKDNRRAGSILEMESGSYVDQDEKDHIRKTVMEKEGLFLDILDLLRRVPRRMLMVLKLNDLTRSLDASLHTTHGGARPFIIQARYCAMAVWQDDRDNLAKRWNEEGLSFGLLRAYLRSWWEFNYFYRGLGLLELSSDGSARLRKVYAYTRRMVCGMDAESARRAAAGLEDQAERKRKEEVDRLRAREALRGEREQEGDGEEDDEEEEEQARQNPVLQQGKGRGVSSKV